MLVSARELYPEANRNLQAPKEFRLMILGTLCRMILMVATDYIYQDENCVGKKSKYSLSSRKRKAVPRFFGVGSDVWRALDNVRPFSRRGSSTPGDFLVLSGTIFFHGTAVWSICFMGRGRK
jgi:hypothetical protein